MKPAILLATAICAVMLFLLYSIVSLKANHEDLQEQIGLLQPKTTQMQPRMRRSDVTQLTDAIHSLENRFLAHVEDNSVHSREVVQGSDGPCAVNPSLHYEDTGIAVPECPPRGGFNGVWDPKRSLPQKALMLSLPGHFDNFAVRRDAWSGKGLSIQRFRGVEGAKTFGHLYSTRMENGQNITVYKDPRTQQELKSGDVGFLTAGERGYIASMKTLFEEAIGNPTLKSVLVFDDDALLSCNFEMEIQRVLSDPRCGDIVSHDGRGGVLMLGTAIWINGTYPERTKWTGGWQQVDNDMNQIERMTGKETYCFNVDRKSLGSFAVIYHRAVFQPIIDWCGTTSKPFDHIWHFLTQKGFPVRAAYPSVAIQDVRHRSSVDPSRAGQEDMSERAAKHRWDLRKYCDPTTQKSLASKGGDDDADDDDDDDEEEEK